MSEKELITEFLLAAEQGNADGLKSCLTKMWILTPLTARGVLPLLLPA